MGFDDVFVNKVRLPLARPRLAAGGEHTIVWTGQDGGLLKRIEELETKVRVLETLAGAPGLGGADIFPSPEIDAETFHEISPDGALLAGVVVSMVGDQLIEVVLFGDPAAYET